MTLTPNQIDILMWLSGLSSLESGLRLTHGVRQLISRNLLEQKITKTEGTLYRITAAGRQVAARETDKAAMPGEEYFIWKTRNAATLSAMVAWAEEQ